MLTTTSSKRYAQAVLQIAREKNNLEEWRSDLRRIAELALSPELMPLLENPKLKFEMKAELVDKGLGEVNPLALNLAYLLITKGKFRDAGQIADEYEDLLNEQYGLKRACVVTAVPLDDPDRQKLELRLEEVAGKKITISVQVDPYIIGGFVARIDGSLLDCSIRSRLESLKKSLSRNTS